MSKISYSTLILVWLAVFGASGFAQQTPTPTTSPTPKRESEAKKIEKDLKDVFRVNSRRSSVSNPADFNTPGVFQIEYGDGGYYRGRDFLAQHVGTLVASLAATERIGFEFDLDTVSSQFDRSRNRATHIGDARIGIQFDFTGETKTAPSFAVSYFAKLPTANVNKRSREVLTSRLLLFWECQMFQAYSPPENLTKNSKIWI